MTPGSHRPALGPARGLLSLALLALLPGLPFLSSSTLAQTPPAPSLEILGSSATGEGIERRWSATLHNPPVATSDAAYAPSVPGVMVQYEPPVEYRWNFGDETGWISTGPRTSASHTYADDGVFVLRAEAWTAGRRVAESERTVEVRNRNPVDLLIAALEIDPARSLYELSATAVDAAGDALTYTWDFGDNTSAEGARVEHAFPIAGTYPVTLTVTDGDGGSAERELDLLVVGAGASEEIRVDSIGGGPATADVATSFAASVRGSLRTDVTGRVRPVAGVHFAPVQDGRLCRFMFTVGDPSQLATAIVILDLPSLPAEGARYRLPFRGSVNFYPDRARYEGSLRVAGRGIVGSEILDRIVAGGSPPPGPVGGAPVNDPRDPTPAALSPLGLKDHVGFQPATGAVELTFVPRDRAVGTFKVGLRNPNHNRDEYPEITFEGRFAIDLLAAAQEGAMFYGKCGDGALEIETLIPEDGEQHVSSSRLGATFSHDVDPATLTADTVQLTYPAAATEAPVIVAARVLRRDRAVILQPAGELFSGVRYTVRLKTGPDGVRGRNGVALEDRDGSGWTTWSFTTRVDFEPGPGTENLACHVYQTVRDAPLIVGKPAVARIYADWKRHPEVHASAQVEEILARVSLESGGDEIATDVHRFIRPPDQWAAAGLAQQEAAHTANLYWTPSASGASSLQVSLEVPGKPNESHAKRYFSQCSTPRWPFQPVLRVDFHMLAINDWRDAAAIEAARPRILAIIGAAGIFMKQIFPFAEVETRFVGTLPGPDRDCDKLCEQNVLARAEGRTDADVVFGFHPVRKGEQPGGSAIQRLNAPAGPQGLVVFALDDDPGHNDRFVFGVAHEVGHTLWLEHMPIVDEASRKAVLDMRDKAWAAGNVPVHRYEGIDGFRIVPTGNDGWNKSWEEGNGEGTWLTPVMYPGSIPYRDSFIMRHHYLKVQGFLERGDGNPKAGVPLRE